MTDETPCRILVDVVVAADTPAEAARASEVLTRAATGLALDGMSVQVTIEPADDDGDACTCEQPCGEENA